jgi:MATE family multidrug resistance protein
MHHDSMTQTAIHSSTGPDTVAFGERQSAALAVDTPPLLSTRRHVIDTSSLAAPIAMGQLSKQLMQAVTLILFGTMHPETLAAGGLAVRISITTHILSAVLLTVGASVAMAQGAGDARRVTALYWNGLYLTALLSLVSFIWFSNAHFLLTALDLPPDVVRDTQTCLDVMRWAEPANLLSLGLMRGVLPAFGLARIQYLLTPFALVVYVAGAFLLSRGMLGLPSIGWVAIPITMVASRWVTALVMLAIVHATAYRKNIPIIAPRLSVLGPMLRFGVPFGIVQALDTLFFFVTTLMIGRLGAVPLAAHQIVMGYGILTSSFAVSAGDAGSLRVSYLRGRRSFVDARRAGFIGMILSLTMTSLSALLVFIFPDFFVGMFIDLDVPQNQAVVAASRELFYLSLLWVLADGVYLAALGLPRATDDNRFAAVVVPLIYWGVGLPTAIVLASVLELGLVGYWYAFVLALGGNAVVLTVRYAWVTRPSAQERGAPLPELSPLLPAATDRDRK